jgi:hypothetical protein
LFFVHPQRREGEARPELGTDSTIVRNRLVVKNVIFKKFPSSQRMFALANECLEIMNRFGKFQVIWKGRANNVERFGH